MVLKLHCFGESGNAYKCALAMELAGVAWEPVFVDFFKGGTRTPEFLALNEMGEVPVLEDGDTVLSQSGAILWHLVGKTGRFGGTTPAETTEVWRWVLWDNHKFSSNIGTARFLMNFLAPEKRSQPVIDFFQGRLRSAYKVLDGHLKGRDWIVGDGITAADLSCCSYLYYPESFGFNRNDWPHVAGWLDRIAALPGWQHPYDLMRRAFPG